MMRSLAALILVPALLAAQQPDPLGPRSKGSRRAPITVYEMSDFQCPFCKRHSEQTFPALEKEYIATGKVRWIFINFPLPTHANAPPAAEFAMCAADHGRFWAAHDLLYLHQETWAPLENPTSFFMSLADTLRLSRDQIRACLESGRKREEIQSDAAGAVRSGANSTPAFYIEGGMLTGAWPPEVWRPILDSLFRVKRPKR